MTSGRKNGRSRRAVVLAVGLLAALCSPVAAQPTTSTTASAEPDVVPSPAPQAALDDWSRWPLGSQNRTEATDDGAAATATRSAAEPAAIVRGTACPTVVFDGVRLTGRAGDIEALDPVAISLDPGRYELDLLSRDILHRRGQASQPEERWEIELLDADGDVIVTSPPTDDLADDARLGSTTVVVEPDRPVAALRARHHAVSAAPNSIRPLAIVVRGTACPDGRDVLHVVELSPDRKLLGRIGSSANATDVFPIDPLVGRHHIWLESADDHHLVATAGTQEQERWLLEAVGADGEVRFQTSATIDLADDELARVTAVGVHDLTGVTGLRAIHAQPGDDGYNSVLPLAAILAPVDGEDDRPGWHPTEVEVTVAPGQYTEVPIRLVLEQPSATEATIGASSSLADVIVVTDGTITAEAGGTVYRSTLGFTLADDWEPNGDPATDRCTVTGTVQLADAGTGSDGEPIGPALDACVRIEEPAQEPGGYTPGFRTPSVDRVAKDSGDRSYITGELTVGLEFGAGFGDPDVLILEVADAVGGRVIGGLADVATYQLRVDASSLDELSTLAATITQRPEVAFASRRFLAQADSAIPDDAEWDNDWTDWTGAGCDTDGQCDAAPGGNNWYLEAMGLPEAWDLETGSSAVRLGIIDSGFFDGNHEDLAPNVVSVEGRQRSDRAHGERMASSACARGDNGIGISGVSWECSLYLYGNRQNSFAFLPDRSSPEAALAQMIEAVDDDVRIVSMSSAYVDNNDCVASFDTSDAERRANEANDVLARGVEYARRQGKDVLWIMSAGNSCRDVRFGAPSGLALRYPLDVMVVAAVNQNLEPQRVTNFGAGVSVAAPGEDITQVNTTFSFGRRSFGYIEGRDGTSSATALTAGLAALVLAENPTFSGPKIKQCIVAAAASDGVEVVGTGDTRVPAGPLGFSTVDAPAALRCRGGVDLPAEVDLVFAVDTSASMGGELARLTDEIVDIADGLAAASPSTDFEYALVNFEDYNGTFDSSQCGPGNGPRNSWSDYGPARYGGAGDSPFRVQLRLDDDRDVLERRVDALSLGNGFDPPESYGRVLWELGQADTRGRLGFRADAATIVVMVGDSVPHSPNLNQIRGAIGEEVEPPFFDDDVSDTGIDPGRNGVVDCSFTAGEDPDIYFQGAAIDALIDNDIQLLFLDSSGGANTEFWQYWAAQTRGAAAAIGTDGAPPRGLDLTTLIIGLLQEA